MMDKDGSITHSRDIRMTPHALSPTPPHREAEERSPPRLPIVELGPMEAKPPRINKRSIPSFSPSPEATELRLRPNTNLPQANRRSNFEPLPSAVWASPPMATTPSLPISKLKKTIVHLVMTTTFDDTASRLGEQAIKSVGTTHTIFWDNNINTTQLTAITPAGPSNTSRRLPKRVRRNISFLSANHNPRGIPYTSSQEAISFGPQDMPSN